MCQRQTHEVDECQLNANPERVEECQVPVVRKLLPGNRAVRIVSVLTLDTNDVKLTWSVDQLQG